MERLSLEQSMEGFSSQSEHTDEADRKRMATKVLKMLILFYL